MFWSFIHLHNVQIMADSNTKRRLFYNLVNFGDNSKASYQSRDKDFKESIKEEESDQSGVWKIENHIHKIFFLSPAPSASRQRRERGSWSDNDLFSHHQVPSPILYCPSMFNNVNIVTPGWGPELDQETGHGRQLVPAGAHRQLSESIK